MSVHFFLVAVMDLIVYRFQQVSRRHFGSFGRLVLSVSRGGKIQTTHSEDRHTTADPTHAALDSGPFEGIAVVFALVETTLPQLQRPSSVATRFEQPERDDRIGKQRNRRGKLLQADSDSARDRSVETAEPGKIL
jgi:hypothetical protein